jgi:hypothetical protein
MGEVITMTTEHLLTVQQTADYFQVSKAAIRNWERTRKIKGVRVVGSLRFECSEIRDLLQAQKPATE